MKRHAVETALSRTALSCLGVLGALASVVEADAVPYTYYRFTPTVTRTPGNTLCQISEFVFYHEGAVVDNTGVIVTNPGGGSPGAEGPEKLIDELTSTKWLGGFGNPQPPIGSLVFQFPSEVTIDGYAFATANDANDRDPVSWTLEGSPDGLLWDPIDTIESYPVPTARQTYLTDVTKPAIIEFFADSRIVPNGTPVFFDWTTAGADDAELNPGAQAVSVGTGFVELTPPDDSETTYSLTASNAGSDPLTRQVLLETVEPAQRTFRYVRFSPVKLRNAAATNSIQIAEFEFFSDGVEVVPQSVVVDGTPNSPASGNENVDKLIDGSLTSKWLDFQKIVPVIFDFGTETTFDAYQFFTANDAPNRDPVRWIIEGRNTVEDEWMLLESLTAYDFPVPQARGQATQFVPIPFKPGSPPAILTFAGQAASLIAGNSESLFWEVAGADTIEIDQGIGTVASSGSVNLTPGATTTYTITATAGIYQSTQTFTINIVDPPITEICYENFDAAGDELELIGDAKIINDSAVIALPGDNARLRLTDDAVGRAGTAWFRRKIDVAGGFDMTCGLHMVSPSANGGADGMAFLIQNLPGGTALTGSEDGLVGGGLAVCFDSYQNEGEPSAGFIEIRHGGESLFIANLSELGVTLAGTDATKFTDDGNDSAPYEVRVAYTSGSPGTLDVFFEGTHVIQGLPVDLGTSDVTDEDGKAFVGFGARTGGLWQNHDVTSWCLTEGNPVFPADLTVTGVALAGSTLTVDFTGPAGTDTGLFTVAGSADLSAFPDDRTSSTTITETSAGVYQAVIDVTGAGTPYFVRIALP